MKINLYKFRLIFSAIILILVILGFYGVFYPLKLMDLQFAPLLQRVLTDFSIIAVILSALMVITALICGRIYCSSFCPFGILQEFCSKLIHKAGKGYFPNKWSRSKWDEIPYRYLIAGILFGTMFGGTALLIRYFEPYSIFGTTVTFSIFGIIFTIVTLISLLYKNRFFCANLCPVGAILGIISKFSVFKINIDDNKCVKCGICAGNCPSYSIIKPAGIPLTGMSEQLNIDHETCLKCFKCLTVCPNNAIKFSRQPVKFNLKRRNLIFGLGAIALLGAGYSAGISFAKSVVKKVKDIILPAGAVNTERMANLCLNCNLCIKNCPNKILTKADEKFPAVHIDYSKGKRFCEYDCNKCSSVCPSGAIKKISLKEKQKTKIASASADKSCIGCYMCERLCPTGAIIINDDRQAIIDNKKCIGCGRCAANCPAHSIKIFAVNEQNVI